MTSNPWPRGGRRKRAQWARELGGRIERLRRLGAPQPAGLLDWGRTYLPAHFRQAPSQMHRWLADQLDGLICAGGSS